jgi:hypothetical protein
MAAVPCRGPERLDCSLCATVRLHESHQNPCWYTLHGVHIGNPKLICQLILSLPRRLRQLQCSHCARLHHHNGCTSVAIPSSGHHRTCRGAACEGALPATSWLRSCLCSSDGPQLSYDTGHTATCPPCTITLPAPAAPQAAFSGNKSYAPGSQPSSFSRLSSLLQAGWSAAASTHLREEGSIHGMCSLPT